VLHSEVDSRSDAKGLTQDGSENRGIVCSHGALVVTDYDRRNGVLSVTKARVNGIDQDVTKTREDRRVLLCPRAIAILERHLLVRERWCRAGLIHHEHLFQDRP
jgi:hypothetical protein